MYRSTILGASAGQTPVTLTASIRSRVGETLSRHYPTYIEARTDAEIRARFPIRLEEKDMRPGNGRW